MRFIIDLFKVMFFPLDYAADVLSWVEEDGFHLYNDSLYAYNDYEKRQDNLLLDEIINGIRKGPLKKVMAALSDACTLRMTQPEEGLPSKPDDTTFVLFRPDAASALFKKK